VAFFGHETDIGKQVKIAFTFLIFYTVIFVCDKNMLNWGFLIVTCAFLAADVATDYENPDPLASRKKLMRGWNIIIYYAAFVLLAQTTYQFASLPIIFESLQLQKVIDILPPVIKLNGEVWGFYQFKDLVWLNFLGQIVFLVFGIYIRRVFQRERKNWQRESEVAEMPEP